MEIFHNIKEVINFEITNVKKDILEYEHITKFSDDSHKQGDCINNIQNAKDIISEYQKILDFAKNKIISFIKSSGSQDD